MDSRESIRKMLYDTHTSQTKLAQMLGKRQGAIASYLVRSITIDKLVKVADILGFDIIFRNRNTSETWILTEAGDDE